MIDREELGRIAILLNLKPWQAEKRYVQSAALLELAEHPLIFKGGTYLWFSHGLQRFSEDLDFSANGEIGEGLPGRVSEALARLGMENSIKPMFDDERSLSFHIVAQGPLYTSPINACHVYVQISRREKPSLNAVPMRFDPVQFGLPEKTLSGMALEEVAAEKVRAILTRDKARDVFDLTHLAQKKTIRFNRALADAKLRQVGKEYDRSKFIDAIGKKGKVWKKELSGLVFGELPEFEAAESFLEKWAEEK